MTTPPDKPVTQLRRGACSPRLPGRDRAAPSVSEGGGVGPTGTAPAWGGLSKAPGVAARLRPGGRHFENTPTRAPASKTQPRLQATFHRRGSKGGSRSQPGGGGPQPGAPGAGRAGRGRLRGTRGRGWRGGGRRGGAGAGVEWGQGRPPLPFPNLLEIGEAEPGRARAPH